MDDKVAVKKLDVHFRSAWRRKIPLEMCHASCLQKWSIHRRQICGHTHILHDWRTHTRKSWVPDACTALMTTCTRAHACS